MGRFSDVIRGIMLAPQPKSEGVHRRKKKPEVALEYKSIRYNLESAELIYIKFPTFFPHTCPMGNFISSAHC